MAFIKSKKTTPKTSAKPTTKEKPKKAKTGRMNSIKKEVDGIKFDSIMEANYYEYLKKEQLLGHILSFELQPEYVLLDPYEKYGRNIRGIKYIADFLIVYPDLSERVIDVKAVEMDDFKLKRKMFDAKYPDLYLQLITFNKQTQTWEDFDELKKTRSRIKRERNKKKKENK